LIAYHIDRGGNLTEGQIIDLNKDVQLKVEKIEQPNALVDSLFPDGLSAAGVMYISDIEADMPESEHAECRLANGRPLALWDEARAALGSTANHIIEYNLELIRRLHFPDKLSRFQAFYCLEDLSAFLDWPELTNTLQEKAKLFEIELEDSSYSRLDSRLLQGGVATPDIGFDYWFSPLWNYQSAMDYWSGAFSGNPRFELLARFPIKIGREIPLERAMSR